MENWAALRGDFRIKEGCVYLDNGAKVPLAAPVLRELKAFNQFCSAAGRDYDGWWKTADDTRLLAARLLGGRPEEICYTASSTQAVNLIAQGLDWREGDNVIVSAGEFPSNLYPWLNLKAKGVEIRMVWPTKQGELSPERYQRVWDFRTRLIAVSHVQAANGYREDLEELGRFCHQNGSLFFVDATQSCGLFPIDVERMKIDFLCASTYKWLMGVDGLALLYCRRRLIKDVAFSYLGWSGRINRNDYDYHPPGETKNGVFPYEAQYPREARRFELGNLNYTAITALNAALRYQKSIGMERIMERTMQLVGYLKAGLKKLPEVTLMSDFSENRQGALVTFSCPDFQSVHAAMTKEGVLSSLKHNGIRFSPFFYNTNEDIDLALEVLKHCFNYK